MTCGCTTARQARPILSSPVDATPRRLAVPEGRLRFRTDVQVAGGGAFVSIDGGQTAVPFSAQLDVVLDIPARADVIITGPAGSHVVVVITEP
jgi:hypothetical protein